MPNQNPYLDPNMNPAAGMPYPGGFAPNMGQPVGPDGMPIQGVQPNPFAMPQGFVPEGYQAEFFGVENMASPQDIYANQGAVAQGAPVAQPGFDPNFQQPQPVSQDPLAQQAVSAQPYQDPAQVGFPFGQQPMPGSEIPAQQWQPGLEPQPYGFDPMGQMPQEHWGYGMPGMEGMPMAGMPGMYPMAPQGFQEQMAFEQVSGHDEPQIDLENMLIEPIDHEAAKDSKATLSLILGIVAVIFVVIPPIGIVVGAIANNIAKNYVKNGGESGKADIGRILALVGLIISCITLLVLVFFVGLILGSTSLSMMGYNIVSMINSSFIGSIVQIPMY